MNSKIPIGKLAEALSKNIGCSSEESERILKTVFGLTGEILAKTGEVDFPELGKFKANRDTDDKVEFTADGNWESKVNAPFAIFSPTELPDSLRTESVEDIQLVVPENHDEIIDGEEVSSTDDELLPLEMVEEIAPNPSDQENAKTQRIESIPVVQPIKQRKTETEHIESTCKEQSAGIPTKPIELDEQPVATQTTKTGYSSDTPRRYQSTYEDEEYATNDIPSSRFGKGFIIGLVVGLAIGALALCCYVFYYVNTSQPELKQINIEEEALTNNGDFDVID